MTAPRPTATPVSPHRPVAGAGYRRTASPLDWALVILSWVSLAAGIVLLLSSPSWLQYADAIGCALFLLAICWRWLRFRIGWRYLRRHWWEVIALVPLLPLVPDGPLWLGVLVAVARFARAADRTDNVFGDRITAQTINHFSNPIIETIKRPITVAVLDEVIDVIQAGTYAANVKAALDENRTELEAMVLDLVRNDPTTGKLRYVPFHDEIVQMTADTVLRIVDGALEDPRTTELIGDIIRNSATQLRQAVRSKD
ncbi:ion transporter [Nocardioides sp. BP30]|uniref:ion transporter n=1 Tax=Nocardioides sp. BP30 TaxID=3036374 RepID=UPI0024684E05|nr:ion transporter [Nocardioides sp. BP30]WGL51115.1 ion transporter [Nocardioides sp. BP30]